jgi:hypothetical protein
VSAHYLRKGYGFDVGANFGRAMAETPIELAPTECAKSGHVIGYIPENPASSLGFLKYGHNGKVRIHVPSEAIAKKEAVTP